MAASGNRRGDLRRNGETIPLQDITPSVGGPSSRTSETLETASIPVEPASSSTVALGTVAIYKDEDTHDLGRIVLVISGCFLEAFCSTTFRSIAWFMLGVKEVKRGKKLHFESEQRIVLIFRYKVGNELSLFKQHFVTAALSALAPVEIPPQDRVSSVDATQQ